MSAMEISLLNAKMGYHQWLRVNDFILAEVSLQEIEQKLTNRTIESCFIDTKNGMPQSYYSWEWWKQNVVCILDKKDHQVLFYLEQLDSDPCARMSNSGQKLTSTEQGTDIYRITLRSSVNEGERSRMIQSTFALPTLKKETCLQSPYPLSYGRQSWREITL